MPTPRVLMSKIRQALRLLADAGLSMRQVAAALGVSKSTVSEIAMYARDAGVDWPLASTLSDDELQARLYPPPRPRSSTRQEPDYAVLHQELKRPGVTLQLLWEEYRAGAGDAAYRYSAFCEKYRAWVKRQKRSMRQVHPGGERLFVDYAGQTVPVVDLAELNERPFKRLPGCRASAFLALDAPALKPLPAQALVLAQFKPARVNIDYHVGPAKFTSRWADSASWSSPCPGPCTVLTQRHAWR